RAEAEAHRKWPPNDLLGLRVGIGRALAGLEAESDDGFCKANSCAHTIDYGYAELARDRLFKARHPGATQADHLGVVVLNRLTCLGNDGRHRSLRITIDVQCPQTGCSDGCASVGQSCEPQ